MHIQNADGGEGKNPVQAHSRKTSDAKKREKGGKRGGKKEGASCEMGECALLMC